MTTLPSSNNNNKQVSPSGGDLERAQVLPSGEDLEGAKALLSLSSQIAQKQPEAIALLNQVYLELFNQTIQKGCGNCYQKAFFRIQKHLYLQQQNDPLNNHTTMTIINRKYLLKPDRILQTTFGGDTLTNDNLTDEAAEKLLNVHPALIKHFDRYPEKESEKPKVKNQKPILDALPPIEKEPIADVR